MSAPVAYRILAVTLARRGFTLAEVARESGEKIATVRSVVNRHRHLFDVRERGAYKRTRGGQERFWTTKDEVGLRSAVRSADLLHRDRMRAEVPATFLFVGGPYNLTFRAHWAEYLEVFRIDNAYGQYRVEKDFAGNFMLSEELQCPRMVFGGWDTSKVSESPFAGMVQDA